MGIQAFLWLASDEELGRLRTGAVDPTRYCYAAYEAQGDCMLELGKMWGAMHHLLAGSRSGPTASHDFLFDGGHAITHEAHEVGDVQAIQAFESGTLQKIGRALNACRDEDLMRRFDPVAMDRVSVYPGHWTQCGEGTRHCLHELLRAIREHVQHGIARRLGMLGWLE